MGGEMMAFRTFWGQAFLVGSLKERLMLFLILMSVTLGTYGLLTIVLKAIPRFGKEEET
jgi:hypothetical protein